MITRASDGNAALRSTRLTSPSAELRRSRLGPLLEALGRIPRCRERAARLALRLEGGAFFSATARELLERHYGVRIGAYSYGECFEPGVFPAGVSVGRYVSIASGVRVLLRNHPVDRLSTHPFFFHAGLGCVARDLIETGTLEIGHDAWLGTRVIVTAGCRQIGIGAVIGAGAVVTRDVPDFAVVAGVPARLVRWRFAEPLRAAILASRWWERPLADCLRVLPAMLRPMAVEPDAHPLLRGTDSPNALPLRSGLNLSAGTRQ